MTLTSQAVPPVEEDASLIEAVDAWQPNRAADEMRRIVRAARREVLEHFEKRQGAGRGVRSREPCDRRVFPGIETI